MRLAVLVLGLADDFAAIVISVAVAVGVVGQQGNVDGRLSVVADAR
ncbi:MAG: hypothetical protein R2726_11520 [Acidimicrobiales bacterium]